MQSYLFEQTTSSDMIPDIDLIFKKYQKIKWAKSGDFWSIIIINYLRRSGPLLWVLREIHVGFGGYLGGVAGSFKLKLKTDLKNKFETGKPHLEKPKYDILSLGCLYTIRFKWVTRPLELSLAKFEPSL